MLTAKPCGIHRTALLLSLYLPLEIAVVVIHTVVRFLVLRLILLLILGLVLVLRLVFVLRLILVLVFVLVLHVLLVIHFRNPFVSRSVTNIKLV